MSEQDLLLCACVLNCYLLCFTALHMASANGHCDVVRLLIQQEAVRLVKGSSSNIVFEMRLRTAGACPDRPNLGGRPPF